MAAGFCTDLTMGSAWALCQDIGKRYSAIVAGLMNMIGNFGGTLANLVSGYVLDGALDAHAAARDVDVVETLAGGKASCADARLPDDLPHICRHVHDWFSLLAVCRRHSAGCSGRKTGGSQLDERPTVLVAPSAYHKGKTVFRAAADLDFRSVAEQESPWPPRY